MMYILKQFRILLTLLLVCFCLESFMAPKTQEWKLNTSNEGKLKEFQHLFGKYGCSISATHVDLAEIDASPLQVVVHKASQMDDYVVIEDTSLDIEGADVGVNIRWLLDHLADYEGRKAYWKVLLAYRISDKVYVFQGTVDGTIVTPRGKDGFGFDPVFLPQGALETLAQSKPDSVNARALAVESLINNQPIAIESPITEWEGPWQSH